MFFQYPALFTFVTVWNAFIYLTEIFSNLVKTTHVQVLPYCKSPMTMKWCDNSTTLSCRLKASFILAFDQMTLGIEAFPFNWESSCEPLMTDDKNNNAIFMHHWLKNSNRKTVTANRF